MNHLEHLTSLRNRYFALRHGESLANVTGTVVSDIKNGAFNYELTLNGVRQVVHSVRQFSGFDGFSVLDSQVIIYSSDFLRAKETADVASRILGSGLVIITDALRERYFGREFEGMSGFDYGIIYRQEGDDPDYSNYGSESVNSVLERTTGLVKRLEEEHFGKKILLVSHGDPIMILDAGFRKFNPMDYKIIPCIRNAEIKELKLTA